MSDRVIYVDNNASTRPRDEVLAAMLPWFTQNWANPSSSNHAMGRAARRAIDNARGEVAQLVGCHPDEIVFSSGASEANALAIYGARPGGAAPRRILTSDIEHHSVLSSCHVVNDRGSEMSMVPVASDGYVTEAAILAAAPGPGTLVSLQWVNNETGAINPMDRIAPAVKERGAMIHADAAQAPGKIVIDVRSVPVDLLTISAHKFHGPKGVGALFVRRGTPIEPLIRGGGQERRRRAGTENVPGVVGLGEACRLLRRDGAVARERITELRDRLEQGLLARCEETIVIRPNGPRAGNTSVCAWEGLENRELLRALDAASIYAASGSACTSDVAGPSHVLKAMNIDANIAQSAIRFSLGRDNTPEEIDAVIEATAAAVSRLRQMVRYER